jgi:hypothetical protein
MIEHKVRYVIDWALLAKWSNAANIVIALFAGVVCFVYWRQLVTMRTALAETRASNEIAARALELGRRAWVVIHGTPGWSNEEQGWMFNGVSVENVSDTPAVVSRYAVGRLDENIADNDPGLLSIRREKYDDSGQVVVRGKPFYPFGYALFGQTDALSLVNPPPLFCIVEYTDCFEKTWRTTIAWQEGPDEVWEPIPYYTSLK